MKSISLYFGWVTVKEEAAYLPQSDSFIDWLVTEGRSVPRVREVLYTCQSMQGVDLFGLLRRKYDPNVFFEGRPFQAALFVAIGYFLEEVMRTKIASVGFYSAGAGPAYVFSNVFSLATYLGEVVPFQREVRRAFEEVAQRCPLCEVIIEGDESEQIEDYFSTVVRREGLTERVFLKDLRRHNAVHLAGFADDVSSVRKLIWDQFPGSRASGLKLHPTVAAHLPLYDREPIDRILDAVGFGPPRFPLVTTEGLMVARGLQDEDLLRKYYADASQAPMDTGAAFDRLAASAESILVVGTPLGAKALRRLERNSYPAAQFATDAMLLSRNVTQSI